MALRTIGGSVGGVEMIFDGEPALEAGEQYIVFLESVPWPTQEESETVLAPVAEGQGMFTSNGAGSYVNAAGLALPESFAQ